MENRNENYVRSHMNTAMSSIYMKNLSHTRKVLAKRFCLDAVIRSSIADDPAGVMRQR